MCVCWGGGGKERWSEFSTEVVGHKGHTHRNMEDMGLCPAKLKEANEMPRMECFVRYKVMLIY